MNYTQYQTMIIYCIICQNTKEPSGHPLTMSQHSLRSSTCITTLLLMLAMPIELQYNLVIIFNNHFLQEMQHQYRRQQNRTTTSHQPTEQYPLQDSNTNLTSRHQQSYLANNLYTSKIHPHQENTKEIARKGEALSEKVVLKSNQQNNNFLLADGKKTYEQFQHNKSVLASNNVEIQRGVTTKGKSQLQSNRELLQKMKSDLHSKLNELTKQTEIQSVRNKQPMNYLQQENEPQKQIFNHRVPGKNPISSHSLFKQTQKCKDKSYLLDKSYNNKERDHLKMTKHDESISSYQYEDVMNQQTRDKAERNNKMIEQEISKLDKRIQQIQANKRKTLTVLKKDSDEPAHDQPRAKRRESHMPTSISNNKRPEMAQKSLSPLNDNWKEYNNRYKNYVNKIKPLESIIHSEIYSKDSAQLQVKTSKSKDNAFFKQAIYSRLNDHAVFGDGQEKGWFLKRVGQECRNENVKNRYLVKK